MTHQQKTPRERRHARTRQDIIDASMSLIVQEGFESLSLREIARRIEYSPAGLYEYFDGKDALIDAVCQDFNNRLLMMLKAVPEDLSVEDYIVDLGLAYVTFARANPQLFVMFFTHFPSPATEVPQQGDLETDDSFSILFNGVQRGIDAGIFEPGRNQTFEIAYSIWTLVHGMAMIEAGYLNQLDMDFVAVDRRAIKALITGLRTEKA